jgi:nitric oxide dioxygenase
MMTPEQIQLVRLSFVTVMDAKAVAGKLFYDRLFAIAPEVRPLFKSDIGDQAEKMMDMLATAIAALKSPQALTPVLEGLGRRHAGYGVRDEHYEKVRDAMLWALERTLGGGFTPQVRDAWTALYGTVAAVMKSAATGRRATA